MKLRVRDDRLIDRLELVLIPEDRLDLQSPSDVMEWHEFDFSSDNDLHKVIIDF